MREQFASRVLAILYAVTLRAPSKIGIFGCHALELIELAISLGGQLGNAQALFEQIGFQFRFHGRRLLLRFHPAVCGMCRISPHLTILYPADGYRSATRSLINRDMYRTVEIVRQ